MQGKRNVPSSGTSTGNGGQPRSASQVVEPLFARLPPGPGRTPDAVAAHQRARLHAAMIEACARHGYPATTARELARLAGVSTRTLYKHFENKEACFLATFELVAQTASRRIAAAYRGGSREQGHQAEGLCRAFDAFTEELIQRPAASRVALVDVLTLGPAALPRIERAEDLFAAMVGSSLAEGPESAATPPKIVRALVGGLWFVARTRLLGAPRESIAEHGAELGRWLLAYRMPAGSRLPRPRSRPHRASPAARSAVRAASRRLRMVQAAADTVARGGYTALSPACVAEAAGVAVAAFEDEFEDTRDCFLTMLEWLSADALAEALRQGEGAPNWTRGVCRTVEALFGRLATDPALARAAFLDGVAVGLTSDERYAAILSGFAAVLARRAPRSGRPSVLTAEAIVGSVWSIAHRCLSAGQPRLLAASSTSAAFIVLAPIVGADDALASIMAERDGREDRKVLDKS